MSGVELPSLLSGWPPQMSRISIQTKSRTSLPA